MTDYAANAGSWFRVSFIAFVGRFVETLSEGR